MTILDRVRGTRRARFDLSQLADELGKRVPDLDKIDLSKVDLPKIELGKVDLPKVDLQKARDTAERAVADAADRARHLRSDLVETAEKVQEDNPLDDLGARLRGLAKSGGIAALVARVERELPDTDKDRYERSYARGRAQGRTTYLVIGALVGLAVGVAAALLLDPSRGRARREAIRRKASGLASDVGETVSESAKNVQDRARSVAAERGIVSPPEASQGGSPAPAPVATPVWPAEAGPAERPLDDPAYGAHEALPEELVHATATADPTEPETRT